MIFGGFLQKKNNFAIINAKLKVSSIILKKVSNNFKFVSINGVYFLMKSKLKG